jgi:hypothetical protein
MKKSVTIVFAIPPHSTRGNACSPTALGRSTFPIPRPTSNSFYDATHPSRQLCRSSQRSCSKIDATGSRPGLIPANESTGKGSLRKSPPKLQCSKNTHPQDCTCVKIRHVQLTPTMRRGAQSMPPTRTLLITSPFFTLPKYPSCLPSCLCSTALGYAASYSCIC